MSELDKIISILQNVDLSQIPQFTGRKLLSDRLTVDEILGGPIIPLEIGSDVHLVGRISVYSCHLCSRGWVMPDIDA